MAKPSALANALRPDELSPPLRALWWLRKGNFVVGPEWKMAHELCQTGEGEHAFDLVHALVHWIEGDAANTAYWYRKVGGTRAADIESEWQRIADVISMAGQTR